MYIDGQLVVTANTGANDSTPTSPPGDLSTLPFAYRLSSSALAGGTVASGGSKTHRVAVELFSAAVPDLFVPFNVRLEAYESVDVTANQWLPLDAARYADGVRAVLGGSADVQSLSEAIDRIDICYFDEAIMAFSDFLGRRP